MSPRNQGSLLSFLQKGALRRSRLHGTPPMSDYQPKGGLARARDVLENEIMSPSVAKSDREWWACHEIEQLRQDVKDWTGRYNAMGAMVDVQAGRAAGAEAELAKYRFTYCHFCEREHPGAAVCEAQPTADPPQNCDWPFCGCDPYAARVLATISECGLILVDAPPPEAPKHDPDRRGWGEQHATDCKCPACESYAETLRETMKHDPR